MNILILALLLLSACGSSPISNRESSDDFMQKGVAYEAEGRRDKARDVYEAALKNNPNFVAAHIALGTLDLDERKYDDAERAFQHAITLQPLHPGANWKMAKTLLAQNERLKQAAFYAQRAANPQSQVKPFALKTLSDIYEKQERYLDAIRTLDAAIQALSPVDRSYEPQWLERRRQIKTKMYKTKPKPATSVSSESEPSISSETVRDTNSSEKGL